MKQIQANRLVALMNLMQTIPPRAFDIDHWAEFEEEKDKRGNKLVELKCGTTACAVGWAALSIPSWKKAFKFTRNGEMHSTLKDANGYTHDNEFSAVAQFLGITLDEADYMFSNGGYTEEEEKSPLGYVNFKVTKPMLFAHCKTVLDNYGYVWA